MRWDAGSTRLYELTRRAAWILLVIGVCGFLIEGASRPAEPSLLPPGGRINETGLKAFDAALFTVVPRAGSKAPASPRCVLVARTARQIRQGLQGQPTLHDFAGMMFVYPHQTTAAFSEKNLDLALSVAWFDSRGRYVAAVNARACRLGQACVTYSAGRPYQYALAVPAGGLGALGVGPGSVMQLSGPCSG